MKNNFQTELAKQLQDRIYKEGSNKTVHKDIKNNTTSKKKSNKSTLLLESLWRISSFKQSADECNFLLF